MKILTGRNIYYGGTLLVAFIALSEWIGLGRLLLCIGAFLGLVIYIIIGNHL